MAKPRQLPGPRPARPRPEPQPHQWVNDWLNHPNGGATCKRCGCTKLGGGLIRADRQVLNADGTKGQMNHYTDVHGNTVSTFEELSCPVYLGDPGSAAATAKEHVRRVKGRVDVVEDQVDSIEERLARLEAENAELRDALDRKPDAEEVVEFLTEVARAAMAARQLETVDARGGRYHVPRQLVDVIDAVSIIELPERERVLVGGGDGEAEEG